MNRPASIDASALLKKHGFRPRHRLGQNFLQDTAVLERIAAEAGVEPDDTVLEIGCGFGSLTQYLAPMARSVVAVELDERLLIIARAYLSSYRNVHLLCADILKLTARELNLPPAYIVAANIPYYLSSPILRHLLGSDPKPRRLVLTIQKEVARRICAKPPDMSLLTLSVQLYGAARIVAEIPPVSFFPLQRWILLLCALIVLQFRQYHPLKSRWSSDSRGLASATGERPSETRLLLV